MPTEESLRSSVIWGCCFLEQHSYLACRIWLKNHNATVVHDLLTASPPSKHFRILPREMRRGDIEQHVGTAHCQGRQPPAKTAHHVKTARQQLPSKHTGNDSQGCKTPAVHPRRDPCTTTGPCLSNHSASDNVRSSCDSDPSNCSSLTPSNYGTEDDDESGSSSLSSSSLCARRRQHHHHQVRCQHNRHPRHAHQASSQGTSASTTSSDCRDSSSWSISSNGGDVEAGDKGNSGRSRKFTGGSRSHRRSRSGTHKDKNPTPRRSHSGRRRHSRQSFLTASVRSEYDGATSAGAEDLGNIPHVLLTRRFPQELFLLVCSYLCETDYCTMLEISSECHHAITQADAAVWRRACLHCWQYKQGFQNFVHNLKQMDWQAKQDELEVICLQQKLLVQEHAKHRAQVSDASATCDDLTVIARRRQHQFYWREQQKKMHHHNRPAHQEEGQHQSIVSPAVPQYKTRKLTGPQSSNTERGKSRTERAKDEEGTVDAKCSPQTEALAPDNTALPADGIPPRKKTVSITLPETLTDPPYQVGRCSAEARGSLAAPPGRRRRPSSRGRKKRRRPRRSAMPRSRRRKYGSQHHPPKGRGGRRHHSKGRPQRAAKHSTRPSGRHRGRSSKRRRHRRAKHRPVDWAALKRYEVDATSDVPLDAMAGGRGRRALSPTPTYKAIKRTSPVLAASTLLPTPLPQGGSGGTLRRAAEIPPLCLPSTAATAVAATPTIPPSVPAASSGTSQAPVYWWHLSPEERQRHLRRYARQQQLQGQPPVVTEVSAAQREQKLWDDFDRADAQGDGAYCTNDEDGDTSDDDGSLDSPSASGTTIEGSYEGSHSTDSAPVVPGASTDTPTDASAVASNSAEEEEELGDNVVVGELTAVHVAQHKRATALAHHLQFYHDPSRSPPPPRDPSTAGRRGNTASQQCCMPSKGSKRRSTPGHSSTARRYRHHDCHRPWEDSGPYRPRHRPYSSTIGPRSAIKSYPSSRSGGVTTARQSLASQRRRGSRPHNPYRELEEVMLLTKTKCTLIHALKRHTPLSPTPHLGSGAAPLRWSQWVATPSVPALPTRQMASLAASPLLPSSHLRHAGFPNSEDGHGTEASADSPGSPRHGMMTLEEDEEDRLAPVSWKFAYYMSRRESQRATVSVPDLCQGTWMVCFRLTGQTHPARFLPDMTLRVYAPLWRAGVGPPPEADDGVSSEAPVRHPDPQPLAFHILQGGARLVVGCFLPLTVTRRSGPRSTPPPSVPEDTQSFQPAASAADAAFRSEPSATLTCLRRAARLLTRHRGDDAAAPSVEEVIQYIEAGMPGSSPEYFTVPTLAEHVEKEREDALWAAGGAGDVQQDWGWTMENQFVKVFSIDLQSPLYVERLHRIAGLDMAGG